DLIGYKAVALVLLVMVSILAMLFDIWPVLIAALLSALTLNFFFIPPRFTFHITETEDILMFLMYFMVAMVNAVLTNKIKVQEKKARDKEEKENTIRLYKTLFNSLSHELKTPISTIIGATDTLKENETSLSPQVKSTLLAEIGKAGNRLNRQVENLLNMSRLESGMLNVNKDWCDVNELIHIVIHKLDPGIRDRIRFEPGLNLPLFKLDIGLMEQVVYNIVNNALQYTPPDTPITIRALYQDEHCVIEIADQGPGFPDSKLTNIFDPFFRLPETKAGGTGLGLSIAKGFTEAHGGSLTVENLTAGGARFTILIPTETSFLNYIKHE
ncbi:MAG TPA: ATP-binding protein, partial [Saprospiraceae bacterium]|nr:ATP-binding protein [Saprospiraceae bacterium]